MSAGLPVRLVQLQCSSVYSRGEQVSGLPRIPRASCASRRGTTCRALFSVFLLAILLSICSAPSIHAQERREREPNSVYAARRAKLAAEVTAPILLWGFTGREEFSQNYIFEQEDNFYYLTGHNEEGAGLIIFPPQ